MTLIEGGWNGALPKICKHSQSLLMLMLWVGQATAEMGRERKRESERETKKWTQCHTHIPIENNGCSVGKKNCQSLSQFISALLDTSSSYFSFPKLCKNCSQPWLVSKAKNLFNFCFKCGLNWKFKFFSFVQQIFDWWLCRWWMFFCIDFDTSVFVEDASFVGTVRSQLHAEKNNGQCHHSTLNDWFSHRNHQKLDSIVFCHSVVSLNLWNLVKCFEWVVVEWGELRNTFLSTIVLFLY